jgi:N-acetylglucosaminyl-diphospho-decaprenol L-rhamnosyltransferase
LKVNMHVLVCIVSYRSANDISACVGDLQLQTHANFAIEICENGGPEAFDQLLAGIGGSGVERIAEPPAPGVRRSCSARLPTGHLVRCHEAIENGGYAGGVNTCLRAAGQEWDAVWILNPDTRPTPGALAALVARHREGDYGAVGARLVLSSTQRVQLYGGRWRRMIARGYNIGLNMTLEHRPDVAMVERDLDYVHGACMLVGRRFVDDVGLMDESYFLYCEEVDWCLRRGDHKLGYAHDSVVFHDHGSAIGSSLERASRSRMSVYLDERNRLVLTRRHYPLLYPITVILALALTALYLKHRSPRNFVNALSGWWAGVRQETGPPAWLRKKV